MAGFKNTRYYMSFSIYMSLASPQSNSLYREIKYGSIDQATITLCQAVR